MENFKQRLHKIRCFIFDVDGVLTNGALIITPEGEFLRTMNIKDGYSLQLAVKKGYHIAVISGGHSKGVPVRMHRLGVTHVFMGVDDKMKKFEELKEELHLSDEQILYMGDDVPDIKIMQQCGVAVCPSDAIPDVKEICHYVSDRNGGQGCVRDVIEQTMRLHGSWD